MPPLMAKYFAKNFRYGEDTMTISAALELANGAQRGVLTTTTKRRVQDSAIVVSDIVKSAKTVYGINTGFGSLCRTAISAHDTETLQSNILKSHAAGVGEPIDPQIVKLMLVLKTHALALGFSGVRLETLERILFFIDHDVTPLVPKQGSVGASGDLAPLAHLFLPLIGEGDIWSDGKTAKAAKVLRKLDLKPLHLGPKEGLALINGTQFIAAFATRAMARLKNCLDIADIAGAMSLEALLGSSAPFLEKLHALRPHPGAIFVANRLRGLLTGSQIISSHADCGRVQDPYSLRCMPQIHGASRDAWSHLKERLSCELNAITDNPIVFPDGDTVSGGHFHGQPLALPIDYAALAASEIGNVSDRRVYLLLDGKVPGLPTLLMAKTGLNSGFMIAQYVSAALASENKTSCFPASADSIPTSLGQEDHVSMGSIGARKLERIVANLEHILAIELLCAAQGLDFRRPLKTGTPLRAAHELIRTRVSHATSDHILSYDIEAVRDLIASESIAKAVDEAARKSGIDLNGEDHERFGLH